MSTRGINFLHRWIQNNVPEKARADVISVDELTHKLIADAAVIGIRGIEIGEEVDRCWRAGVTIRRLPARSRGLTFHVLEGVWPKHDLEVGA